MTDLYDTGTGQNKPINHYQLLEYLCYIHTCRVYIEYQIEYFSIEDTEIPSFLHFCSWPVDITLHLCNPSLFNPSLFNVNSFCTRQWWQRQWVTERSNFIHTLKMSSQQQHTWLKWVLFSSYSRRMYFKWFNILNQKWRGFIKRIILLNIFIHLHWNVLVFHNVQRYP